MPLQLSQVKEHDYIRLFHPSPTFQWNIIEDIQNEEHLDWLLEKYQLNTTNNFFVCRKYATQKENEEAFCLFSVI